MGSDVKLAVVVDVDRCLYLIGNTRIYQPVIKGWFPNASFCDTISTWDVSGWKLGEICRRTTGVHRIRSFIKQLEEYKPCVFNFQIDAVDDSGRNFYLRGNTVVISYDVIQRELNASSVWYNIDQKAIVIEGVELPMLLLFLEKEKAQIHLQWISFNNDRIQQKLKTSLQYLNVSTREHFAKITWANLHTLSKEMTLDCDLLLYCQQQHGCNSFHQDPVSRRRYTQRGDGLPDISCNRISIGITSIGDGVGRG
jgi:hypothetical protein